MEPISLIVAALVAGATTAAKDAAPDAYKGLKALIKRKFAGEKKAEMVLAEHESDPETYEAPLKKKLAEAGADQDEEILKAARTLLEELKKEGTGAGESYNLNVGGDFQGVGRDVDTGGGDANLNFGSK